MTEWIYLWIAIATGLLAVFVYIFIKLDAAKFTMSPIEQYKERSDKDPTWDLTKGDTLGKHVAGEHISEGSLVYIDDNGSVKEVPIQSVITEEDLDALIEEATQDVIIQKDMWYHPEKHQLGLVEEKSDHMGSVVNLVVSDPADALSWTLDNYAAEWYLEAAGWINLDAYADTQLFYDHTSRDQKIDGLIRPI